MCCFPFTPFDGAWREGHHARPGRKCLLCLGPHENMKTKVGKTSLGADAKDPWRDFIRRRCFQAGCSRRWWCWVGAHVRFVIMLLEEPGELKYFLCWRERGQDENALFFSRPVQKCSKPPFITLWKTIVVIEKTDKKLVQLFEQTLPLHVPNLSVKDKAHLVSRETRTTSCWMTDEGTHFNSIFTYIGPIRIGIQAPDT